MQKYLKQLNDNSNAEKDREEHIAKRILNVIILDIKVEKIESSKRQKKDIIEITPLLDLEKNLTINFSQEIYLRSVVHLRLQYVKENQSLEL